MLSALGQGDVQLLETFDGARFLRLRRSATARSSPDFVAADGCRRGGLRGGADRVELLGLDRSLRGTHLTAGRVWRWDADARRLAEP
jgi:hypothetical protein